MASGAIRQVQIGLVMINGWPNGHHVFDASLPDGEMVETVLKDLRQRFGFALGDLCRRPWLNQVEIWFSI